jgi:hypothetical protein
MEHFLYNITVKKDFVCDHWQDLYKCLRDSLIAAGLHETFRTMDRKCRKLENSNNCTSATYNVGSRSVIHVLRTDNGDTIKEIYDQFILDNSDKLLEFGIYFSEGTVEKNITTNLEIIKHTLQTIPPIVIPTTEYNLLKNLHPIHTAETEFGTLYIKEDYVEFWFNNGTIDFLYTTEFKWQLYFYLYYQMYKRNFLNNDLVRYAFFKIYDYENYISLSPPTENLGKSDLFNPETIINNEYFMLYIDQAAEMIDEWKQIGNLFPNDPIRLENRIQDKVGYYFILLGSALDHTLPQFIKLQFEYLSQILNYLNSKNVNKSDVINYAYLKWTVNRALIYNDTRVPLFPD